VVVGIDFGTTYSGYGYSFRDEYKKDHSKIYCNTDWKSGDGLVTTKTPTVILFDENGKFQSFGYEAEEACIVFP
jgi:molecular chaperone DnaK (HSP70)